MLIYNDELINSLFKDLSNIFSKDFKFKLNLNKNEKDLKFCYFIFIKKFFTIEFERLEINI